ncbi:2-hydroxyacid dehydrogenase [Achromobacter sp. NCFB-sbj8-Ac1-l]|jgi:glyoxylate/hydroxypyruvate reductase A|uniref:2-hydroxyacid dehydrogenase n=1 Tax=unclassified Achromobacter TaxID=2626865 RepID=UPI004046A16A
MSAAALATASAAPPTVMAPVTPDRPPCIALLSRVLDMRYLVPAFQALRPDIAWRTADDLGNPADIDAAVCWQPPAGLLATLPNLRLIQSIGAGVDHLYADPTLPRHVPVCRVAEAGMTAGMSTYVAWAVINHHRHFHDYVRNSAQGLWRESPIVPPSDHRVAIAGLGRLGLAAARALTALGYRVSGWSRTPKPDLPAGITGHHGADGLPALLAEADTLVCLLPLTDDTRGFLGAATFAQLPRGAHVVNAGRGEHLDAQALLAALDSGQLSYATLDATPQEPLPPDHPLWRHPNVLVTPHIATRTPAAAIARQTLDNLQTLQGGGRPDTSADPSRGY